MVNANRSAQEYLRVAANRYRLLKQLELAFNLYVSPTRLILVELSFKGLEPSKPLPCGRGSDTQD